MTPLLTPNLVTKIIQEEEIPGRAKTLPLETVDSIYRFGAPIGSAIELLEKIDRGMEYARDLISRVENSGKSLHSGQVIIARELNSGKGRFDRYWHAPKGGSWMTLIVVNTLLPEFSRLIPLAAGVSCCEALRDYGLDARIKWVNDVLISGKKVVGVLTESFISRASNEEYILVGAGVNVNNLVFPEELSELAGSMKTFLGKDIDLDFFSAKLLAKFSWNFGLLFYAEHERLRQGVDAEELMDFENPLLEQWKSLSDTIGRKVRFGFNVVEKPQYEAMVMGIDNTGGLILKNLMDGSQIIEHSGEIMYLD